MAGRKLTKSEMVNTLAVTMGMTRQKAKETIDCLLGMVVDKLCTHPDNRVSIHGFGTFEVCRHKSRRGVDPRDHDKDITIPQRSVPKFRAGKAFKRMVRESFDEDS